MTVARELHVAGVEEECSVFEPESWIAALVSPILADGVLIHFCLTERVWATLCLVSFWALGTMSLSFEHMWVFVKDLGKFVVLEGPVNPNPIRQAWLGHFVGIAYLFCYALTH